MRTALRTAVATALFAGVAITPALAAGAAFAADGPVAVRPSAGTDAKPSADPSAEAPAGQSAEPVAGAAGKSAAKPSAKPTAKPTEEPSAKPTEEPTAKPSAKPTEEPSAKPTEEAPAGKGPKPGDPVRLAPCTYQWVIPSVFQGMTVTLTHDAEKGPKAVLKDENGTVHATVDRAHPHNGAYGLIIEAADTRTPAFGQRTQGGVGVPYGWTAFTRLPADCYDTPLPELSGPVKTGDCTVQEVTTSAFGTRWRVVLTNDLKKGPKAVLFDPTGVVMDTVDRAHPGLSPFGLRIKGANTLTPVLEQRVQSTEPTTTRRDFPKLPAGCGEKDATTAPAGNGNTTVNTGQTSVIPKGGVAAGAEFGPADDSTALIAAGAGAASLAAAGLGFVVLRRRAAARV